MLSCRLPLTVQVLIRLLNKAAKGLQIMLATSSGAASVVSRDSYAVYSSKNVSQEGQSGHAAGSGYIQEVFTGCRVCYSLFLR